jgi:hypothetical protein
LKWQQPCLSMAPRISAFILWMQKCYISMLTKYKHILNYCWMWYFLFMQG